MTSWTVRPSTAARPGQRRARRKSFRHGILIQTSIHKGAKTLMRLVKQKLSDQKESTGLVQHWKPDAVAPSISSMFAKNASNSGNATAGMKRPFQSSIGTSKTTSKPSPRPISSFFTAPATSPSNSSSTPSKRARLTPSSSSKPKKGSIQNFFEVKKK